MAVTVRAAAIQTAQQVAANGFNNGRSRSSSSQRRTHQHFHSHAAAGVRHHAHVSPRDGRAEFGGKSPSFTEGFAEDQQTVFDGANDLIGGRNRTHIHPRRVPLDGVNIPGDIADALRRPPPGEPRDKLPACH